MMTMMMMMMMRTVTLVLQNPGHLLSLLSSYSISRCVLETAIHDFKFFTFNVIYVAIEGLIFFAAFSH